MNKHTQLVVRSVDRDTQITSTYPSTYFHIGLTKQTGFKSIAKVELEHVFIPNTIYTIRTGINDTLAVTVSATPYTATIAPGFYTVSTLPAAIVTALGAAVSNSWACTISTTTGLITITGTTTFFFSFSTNATIALGKILGYNTSAVMTTGTTQTGTSVVNLSGPTHIYIHIFGLKDGARSSLQTMKPTFIVPINANAGDVILYNSKTGWNQCLYFGNDQILNDFAVYLTFQDGEQVNLNGIDWSMIWNVEYRYE
jgi:hypothetical protein